MEDARDLVRTCAANVRALRTRAGLTLAELAEQTGLGRSTLAQLESGQGNPSMETLWSIAAALGVPFGRLIEAAAPAVRVVRSGEGVQVDAAATAYRSRLIATSPRRGSFELYVLELDAGDGRSAEPHIAGTLEHLFLIRGRLRAGPVEEPVDLGPGDLLTFPGDIPHRYEGRANGTRAVLVMDYA